MGDTYPSRNNSDIDWFDSNSLNPLIFFCTGHLAISGIFVGLLVTVSMKQIKDQIKIVTGKQFTDKIRNIQQKNIKETHRLQSSILLVGRIHLK